MRFLIVSQGISENRTGISLKGLPLVASPFDISFLIDVYGNEDQDELCCN